MGVHRIRYSSDITNASRRVGGALRCHGRMIRSRVRSSMGAQVPNAFVSSLSIFSFLLSLFITFLTFSTVSSSFVQDCKNDNGIDVSIVNVNNKEISRLTIQVKLLGVSWIVFSHPLPQKVQKMTL